MGSGYHKFVSTKCFFVSLTFQFPTCFPFVLVAVMSTYSESNDEGTKLKETPENPKPQSSELVGEVFPYVKGYLNTQLLTEKKLIEGQSKIESFASELDFKGTTESSLR